MDRLKEQLRIAQELYDKDREITLKRADYFVEIANRMRNETYMWAGSKQFLDKVKQNCSLDEPNQTHIKEKDKMINALQLTYNERLKAFTEE